VLASKTMWNSGRLRFWKRMTSTAAIEASIEDNEEIVVNASKASGRRNAGKMR